MTTTNSPSRSLEESKRFLAQMETMVEEPWVKPERKDKLRHLIRAQKAVVRIREQGEAREGEVATREKAAALSKWLSYAVPAAITLVLIAFGLLYIRDHAMPWLKEPPNPYTVCLDRKRATQGETWVQETQCEIAADQAEGAKSAVDQLAWRTELDAATAADRGAITVGEMDRIDRDAGQWGAE